LAKLDEQKVREIRQSKLNNTAAAAVFGIDRTTISQVRRFKTWRHVT